MTEIIQTQPNEGNENDNSSESSTEETNADQTGSPDQNKNQADKKDGSDKGFADDPRWQERENDWKKRFNEQESRHTQSISELRVEIQRLSPKTSDTPIPDWFNGDEKQWAAFNDHNKGLVNQAKTEAMKEFEAKSAEDQKAIDDATTYFLESVASIESDKTINPQGEKLDDSSRNKLLKIAMDNDLVDSKLRWNYRAAYLMMKGSPANLKHDTSDRKKLAGATTSEKDAETRQTEYATSEDFKKPGARPW